ncbi:putative F-box protein At1g32420 [Papaver somniferum]|uniref:putative F-box protein At1g32420 n=1 Tax=Papaver somniferum TaxID=3469 RepID=UPI000E6F5334|nr:putative F-box protein At1g32420 [Papaver somniferum]
MEDKYHNLGTKFPPLICCCSTNVQVSDDLIVCEILSRLPVKSLMRFKCVCKSWQFLIEKDRHFIDLHFARSEPSTFILLKTPNYKTRKPCFLSAKLVLPSEDDGLEGGGATFQRQIIPQIELDSRIHMLEFVNGLVCFANQGTRCFQIYNPSTGESTPWIKSLIKQQKEDEKQVVNYDGSVVYTRAYLNFRWSYFGYNPATKEHKVLSLWKVHSSDESGNCVSDEKICEVLTVGGKQQNSFRKVDEVLLVSPIYLGKSVYVNGSIFWYHRESDRDVGVAIIEFNCGTEKFRVIPIPNSIIDVSRFCRTHLMEVDGRLALLAKKGGRYSSSEVREYW